MKDRRKKALSTQIKGFWRDSFAESKISVTQETTLTLRGKWKTPSYTDGNIQMWLSQLEGFRAYFDFSGGIGVSDFSVSTFKIHIDKDESSLEA